MHADRTPSRSDDREQFRVQLEVYVLGPPAEWDEIANRLADRLRLMRLRGGYLVLEAFIDEAKDDGDAT